MTAREEARPGAPRFRVRYRGTWYELPLGGFVMGRSPGCQLTFDDPRVSRRHACLHVEPHRVTVEDLRSRNGTLVNGVLLRGPMVLSHHDVLTIGSQEICIATGQDAEAAAREGNPTDPDEADLGEATQTGGIPTVITLLDKALRMGSHDEAERMLAQFYGELDSEGRTRQRVPSATVVESITRITMAHASITQRGDWIDQLFSFYHRTRQVMATALVDEVASLLRRIRHPLSAQLRQYTEWLIGESDRLSQADRFALQRVEALVRSMRGQSEG